MLRTAYGVFTFLLLTATAPAAQLGYLWSFGELHSASDLVVVAALGLTRDTGHGTTILGVPMVELNTEFRVALVVKGSAPAGTIVLLHYRLDEERIRGGIANGPHWLDWTGNRAATEYLLFLKRGAGGSFVPTSGQVFPGDSVFGLRKAG